MEANHVTHVVIKGMMKFPRFSGHLQRPDQDSGQEVRSEETRTEGV